MKDYIAQALQAAEEEEEREEAEEERALFSQKNTLLPPKKRQESGATATPMGRETEHGGTQAQRAKGQLTELFTAEGSAGAAAARRMDGAQKAAEKSGAQQLGERLRRTRQAAAYEPRQKPDKRSMLSPKAEMLTAAGPEELDLAFERDARRYDGEFELY